MVADLIRRLRERLLPVRAPAFLGCAYCRGLRCPCTCDEDCGGRWGQTVVHDGHYYYPHTCRHAPDEDKRAGGWDVDVSS